MKEYSHLLFCISYLNGQIHKAFCWLVDMLNIRLSLLNWNLPKNIIISSENFPEINEFSNLSTPFLTDNKVLTFCEMLNFIKPKKICLFSVK